jgi:hypothetical protein
LGTCASQILRARRHRHQCQTRKECCRDALFDIERDINGLAPSERLQRRQKNSRPLVDELQTWLRSERTKLSRSSPVTEPIDYMLKRWDGFTAFLGDGRVCLTNNAAERALRGFALGGSRGSSPAPIVVLTAPPSWQR